MTKQNQKTAETPAEKAKREAVEAEAAKSGHPVSNPHPTASFGGPGKTLTADEQAEADRAAATTQPLPSNDKRTLTEKARDAGAPAHYTTEQQAMYAQAQASADVRNVKGYADIVDWYKRTKNGTVNA
jgi:hypothetical protein